jgi:hypothetical protein
MPGMSAFPHSIILTFPRPVQASALLPRTIAPGSAQRIRNF